MSQGIAIGGSTPPAMRAEQTSAESVPDAGTGCWILCRNCSLRPGQLAAMFACVGGVSCLVALVCAFCGAWYVLVFCGIEQLALCAAFVVYARHAGDYEKVVVSDQCVLVESACGGRITRTSLALPWVAVRMTGTTRPGGSLIRLGTGMRCVTVGRFVPAPRRSQVAREIRAALERSS